MEPGEVRKSFTYYIYIAFAIMVLITCWESNRMSAAVMTPTIPEESIRIRILANSDSSQDQALKAAVRDAVVVSMQNWVSGPQTIQQARALINTHLAELDLLVGDMIRERGYSYTHQIELGKVPFPAKVFGNEVYPAGDYEALRITIGTGQGQNWWCVLFPPLCFVDTFTGDSSAAKGTQETISKLDKNGMQSSPAKKKVIMSLTEPAKSSNEGQQPADIEVRFFLWDLIDRIASSFK
jgi:stage II sporulation protein R